MKHRVSSDVALTVARAAHHLSLAALLGGNLFGRVAMSPALGEISDKSERGKVLNCAWRRYGVVNSVALGGLVGGWLPARLSNDASRRLSARERRLAVAKDLAIGAVVVTGLGTAAGGVAFARQAPGGSVPIESGETAAPETPARAARLKHVTNALGALNLSSEVTLVIINALLAREAAAGPPAWTARRIIKYVSGPLNA